MTRKHHKTLINSSKGSQRTRVSTAVNDTNVSKLSLGRGCVTSVNSVVHFHKYLRHKNKSKTVLYEIKLT